MDKIALAFSAIESFANEEISFDELKTSLIQAIEETGTIDELRPIAETLVNRT